jgi:hypothetical protein
VNIAFAKPPSERYGGVYTVFALWATSTERVSFRQASRRWVRSAGTPSEGEEARARWHPKQLGFPKEVHARVIWNMHTYCCGYGCSATEALPAGPL